MTWGCKQPHLKDESEVPYYHSNLNYNPAPLPLPLGSPAALESIPFPSLTLSKLRDSINLSLHELANCSLHV